MTNLQELLAQRDELDQRIRAIQIESRAKAVSEVMALMAANGLSIFDLSDELRPMKKSGRSKVSAKYRNPSTGVGWSGRGLKPKWLQAEIANGKKAEDFLIAVDSTFVGNG